MEQHTKINKNKKENTTRNKTEYTLYTKLRTADHNTPSSPIEHTIVIWLNVAPQLHAIRPCYLLLEGNYQPCLLGEQLVIRYKVVFHEAVLITVETNDHPN